MKLLERDAPRAGLDSVKPDGSTPMATAVAEYVRDVAAIVGLEVRKLAHDPTELVSRAVQPILWLMLFGEVFTRVRGIPTGGVRYLDFMSAGILAQSVLFVAIFYGIAVIWERDMGITVKFLVSPAPRSALVLGKALSAGVRALSQAAIVYAVSAALQVRLQWSALPLLGVVALVVLSSALFSTFSFVIACLVKTQQRFMGIGQIITMPLFFASNAIYPVDLMPSWLRLLSRANPLTYQVDALRALMLESGRSAYGIGVDFAVLFAVTAVLVMVGGRLYGRIVT